MKLRPLIPLALLLAYFCLLFSSFIFKGQLPLPADTLIGAYHPWLDYRWGFPTGVPVKNPLTSDAFSQFFVWKKVVADQIKEFKFPLWNQFSFSGTPLLATFHSAALHPANLLFLIQDTGWGWYIFLSFIFAAYTSYLYLGLWSTSTTARLSGSIIFSLAGPMTTWAEFGTASWAASFMPLFFFFLHRFAQTSKNYYLGGLSTSLALLIFSGHVQIFTYTLVLTPFYCLYLLKSLGISYYSVLKILIAVILGLGIAAPQILSTYNFYSYSIRGEENYASGFNYGLSPWKEIIRLWAADFFGHPASRNHFSSVSYHEYSSFLGTLTLPIIITVFLNKKLRKRSIFPLIIFVLSILLAFDNPLSQKLFSLSLPLLTYSSASRLFFLTNFASSILVSLGIEGLIKEKKLNHQVRVFALLFCVLTLLAIFLVPSSMRLISFRNTSYYLAILLPFCIFSFLFKKKIFILSVIIFFLFTIDLGRYFLKYNTFFPKKLIFPQTPIIEFLQKQEGIFRIGREDTNLMPPNTWSFYQLESVEGYDPLYAKDYAHFFHLLKDDPYTNGVSRYAELEDVNLKFLSALNVKYFLGLDPKLKKNQAIELKNKPSVVDQIIKESWQPVFQDGAVIVYQNPKVLPRAYFVNSISYVADKESLVEKLSDPSFNPSDTAILFGDENTIQTKATDSQISWLTYSSNLIEIEVATSNPQLLMISNNYDPGWQATVNGQKTTILKASGSFQAVNIPPGKHHLRLFYFPQEFKIGLIIACLSITLVLLLSTNIIKLRKNVFN